MTTDKNQASKVSPQEYQTQRKELLDKKLEVDTRLIAAKEQIARAKRELAANGTRADREWFTNQETYVRRLGAATQELQRQLGELKLAHHGERQNDLEHFIYQVLLERYPAQDVADAFREARQRLSQQPSA